MKPKNPKDLYGINIPEKTFWWDKPPGKLIVHNTCDNCNNHWESEIQTTAVSWAMLNRNHDYCSECYKNS